MSYGSHDSYITDFHPAQTIHAETSPATSLAPAYQVAIDTMQVLAQGNDAYRQYIASGDLKSLDIAIQSFRLAIDTIEDESLKPLKIKLLVILAEALDGRFERIGEFCDLEEVISLFRLANQLTPDGDPKRPRRLGSLGISILDRFRREGKAEDLEESIALQTRAVELTPDDHQDKAPLLNCLGITLTTRFDYTGGIDDLEMAILFHSRAVKLTCDKCPDQTGWQTTLEGSLRLRFDHLGILADATRTGIHTNRLLDFTLDTNLNKLEYLTDTATSLQKRFSRLGNLEDVARAVTLQSRAIELLPDSSPRKPSMLNGLASSLGLRYGRTKELHDLEDAVSHQTHAVELTPDTHPGKPLRLSNLAALLLRQFESSRERPEVLEIVITYATRAVTLTPIGHPDKQPRLYNLSRALKKRFEHFGNISDLDKAIEHSRALVNLLPERNPRKAETLRLLGGLLKMCLCSPNANSNASSEAAEVLLKAMEHTSSLPMSRFRAALDYADLCIRFSRHFVTWPKLTLFEAYEYALGLIPQCIWLGNDVRGRYASNELREVGIAVSDVATAAITAGRYDLAMEWLETGRAVIWSQILQFRAPLDDLRQSHPQLADKFQKVSQLLRGAAGVPSASLHHTSADSHDVQQSFDLRARPDSLHIHALEYTILLAEIRNLPGFEAFLRPKTLPQLVDACAGGPVVIINVHKSRCDALVLCDSILHIPLPDLSYADVYAMQALHWDFLKRTCLLGRWRGDIIEGAIEGEGIERGIKPRDKAQNPPLDHTRQLLAMLWIKIVKPIMDIVCTLSSPRSTEQTSTLPHVTWCPTGPLAFLPLHAAGIYPKDETNPIPQRTIMNVAVSSYTPTLEALLKPRMKAVSIDEHPWVLIVSQPNTPGYKPIGATTEESKTITSHLTPTASSTLSHTQGTVQAVLQGMTTHKWIHLACHGIQDDRDPTNSAFALYDGRLTLETLLTTQHLPNADLAVLSACQTATGDKKLSDEAVHLAAGMLCVGYKSVVGTMWSIYDSSAPVLAGEFYRVMAGQVETGGELQPAYALYEATKVLRAKYGVGDFVRWVPFVHFGL